MLFSEKSPCTSSKSCFLARTMTAGHLSGKLSIGSRKSWLPVRWRHYLQAPAEGLWRKGADSAIDEIVIFEVMAEEADLSDWCARRSELERRFRQDRVIIRYMPMALV